MEQLGLLHVTLAQINAEAGLTNIDAYPYSKDGFNRLV
jgi:hypothetical protein